MKKAGAGFQALLACAGFAFLASPLPAADCNLNGRPDEEDLASGASDCNANGFLDECDIALLRPEGASPFRVSAALGPGAAGDLDGDGQDDLAIAGEAVAILLGGERLGEWRPADPVPLVDSRPTSILPVDLDGDGDRDLVVPASPINGQGRMWILRNAGGARFEREPLLSLVGAPSSILAGDLDGDGDVDLAALEWLQPGWGLQVLLNDGRAGLSTFAPLALTGNASFMAAADADGDLDIDLLVAFADPPSGTGRIVALANQGNAAFAPAATTEFAGGPTALAAADVDGDGAADLLAGTVNPIQFAVLKGLGSGTFAPPRPVDFPFAHPQVRTLDHDRDGDLDLAILGQHPEGDGEVIVLLENGGAGEFMRPATLDGLGAAFVMTEGDPDGDGDLDLIAGDWTTSMLWVIENAGGVFGMGSGLITGVGPAKVVAADLDGDQAPDFATANRLVPGISVILRGGAAERVGIETPLPFTPFAFAAADLDGDGDRDLAAAGNFSVASLRNDGAGAFAAAGEPIRIGSNPQALRAADLDGDGDVDLATANSTFSGFEDNVSVLRNLGGGAFASPRNFAAGRSPSDLAISDVDGDGDADLVVPHFDDSRLPGSDDLTVLVNPGDASFLESATLPAVRPGLIRVLAADVEKDGDQDLVAWGDGLAVYRNHGGGVFGKPETEGLEISAWNIYLSESDVVATDMDGDGAPDLVARGRDAFRVSWNQGSAFARPETLAMAGGSPRGQGGSDDPPQSSLAAEDLDGDGDQDLAFLMDGRSVLYLAFNRLEAASRDGDRDGIPDECEPGTPFRRGDANADSTLNLTDAIAILRHLFSGETPPPCARAADADDGGSLDLTDALVLLNHLFQGAPPPAPPFAACGLDSTPDRLPCAAFPPCA